MEYTLRSVDVLNRERLYDVWGFDVRLGSKQVLERAPYKEVEKYLLERIRSTDNLRFVIDNVEKYKETGEQFLGRGKPKPTIPALVIGGG